MKFKEGDKVWCVSSPKGNSVNNYTVGQLYTLKRKSYTAGQKFQGWLTEENSFWIIKEKYIELYESHGELSQSKENYSEEEIKDKFNK